MKRGEYFTLRVSQLRLSDEASLAVVALALLVIVGGCADRGERFEIIGNDVVAARVCDSNGYAFMKPEPDGAVRCFHEPRPDAFDVRMTITEAAEDLKR